MKPPTFLILLSLLLFPFAPPLSSASETSKQPPAISAQAEFSADDFDWRDVAPILFAAAALSPEQGIKAVLEDSRPFRAYVAKEVSADCRPAKNSCAANGDALMLDAAVSKRIDDIVREGIFRRHKNVILDYQLALQPFPFSEIMALKSEKNQNAYLVLKLADRSYTAAQLQAKYGVPYDTNIFQSYSVFTYRVDNPRYTSKAVFEVDPVDGAVMKVAISLKTKNRH